MRKILFLLLICTSACSPRLHKSGSYVIAERTGNHTKLDGLRGTYVIPSDTLKKGDTIQLIGIKRTRHDNS